jgi:hypothetical protein
MRDEDQLAQKIVKVLESGVQSVDAATAARLAEARQKATTVLTSHVTPMHPVLSGWGRVVDFSHHGGYRFWLPLLLLLAALAVALTSMLPARNNQPIDADALLLASELPPEAYADKEFVAWLEHSSQL